MTSFQSLAAIVGPDRFVAAPAETFDAVPVGCRVEPLDAAQVAAVVRECAARKWAVFVTGGRTKQDLGRVPARVDVLLSTACLNRVREYAPRDMTVSVEAGMKLADLQAKLAPDNLWLPINPPHAAGATLGGIAATDSAGFRRFTCGTIKDAIVGIEIATPEGVLTKAGGRVVKNVAGYNLMKLHTGAMGRLGVITAINFKVRPRFAAEAIVRCEAGAKAEPIVADLLQSDVRPAFLEYLAGPKASHRELSIGFCEDTAAAVEWQCSRTADLLRTKHGVGSKVLRAGEFAVAADALSEAFRNQALFKAACPSSRAVEMVERMLARLRDVSPPLTWVIQASLGNGLIYGSAINDAGEEMPDWSEVLKVAPTAAALAELRSELTGMGGSLVLEHAPAALRRAMPVWGPASSPAWTIMERIASTFDPAGIMNPGRMVG